MAKEFKDMVFALDIGTTEQLVYGAKQNGVDHIKLNLSGGIIGPAWDLHRHSFFLPDELKAAFEEAVDDYLQTCSELGKAPELGPVRKVA